MNTPHLLYLYQKLLVELLLKKQANDTNYEKFLLIYQRNRNLKNKCVLVNFDKALDPNEYEIQIWEINKASKKFSISSVTFYKRIVE